MPRLDNDELIGLLWRASQGSQSDFAALYERTSPVLFPLCLRLLRRREWAEEVLQEVYVRIWHQAGEYSPTRGSVLTWMTTIARYRAIDVIRQRRRRPEAPLDEEDWSQVRAEEAGPLELTGQSSEADALQRCMEALSETQRRCIRLAFFQGMTHGELCKQLQKPMGSVKSWIRRGLQSLRQCLKELEP